MFSAALASNTTSSFSARAYNLSTQFYCRVANTLFYNDWYFRTCLRQKDVCHERMNVVFTMLCVIRYNPLNCATGCQVRIVVKNQDVELDTSFQMHWRCTTSMLVLRTGLAMRWGGGRGGRRPLTPSQSNAKRVLKTNILVMQFQ